MVYKYKVSFLTLIGLFVFGFCGAAERWDAYSKDGSGSLQEQIAELKRLAATGSPILFYDQTNQLTYFLGNFYPCKVVRTNVDGSKTAYACSEAMYQAQKFVDSPKLMKKFSKLYGPTVGEDAWKLARDNKDLCRDDWKKVMDACMKEVLSLKFAQNADLQQLLLATDPVELVEHSKRDSYWGDGGDGSGQNRLGKYLVEVRQNLKKAKKAIKS